MRVWGWERREGQGGERDFTQRKMDVAIQVERRWRNIDEEEEVEEEAKCVGDGWGSEPGRKERER